MWTRTTKIKICYVPVAEPTFVDDVSHLVWKLGASFVVGGKSCFRFWVGEGDGERLNKFFIGSVAGNVSLICGDSSAGTDDASSMFSGKIFHGFIR